MSCNSDPTWRERQLGKNVKKNVQNRRTLNLRVKTNILILLEQNISVLGWRMILWPKLLNNSIMMESGIFSARMAKPCSLCLIDFKGPDRFLLFNFWPYDIHAIITIIKHFLLLPLPLFFRLFIIFFCHRKSFSSINSSISNWKCSANDNSYNKRVCKNTTPLITSSVSPFNP